MDAGLKQKMAEIAFAKHYDHKSNASWMHFSAAGEPEIYPRAGGVKAIWYHTNHICHSGIKGYSEGFLFNYIRVPTPHKEYEAAHRAFFAWLCSDDMPYSQHIANRDDVEEVTTRGFFIDYSVSKPTHAYWLCKAGRTSQESPHKLNMWYKFVEEGVDKMLALYLVSVFQPAPASADSLLFYAGDHSTIFHAYFDEDGMKRLLSRTPRKLGKDNFNGDEIFFQPRKGVLYDPDKSEAHERFRHLEVASESDDGWGGKIVNKKSVTVADVIEEAKSLAEKYAPQREAA